VAVVAGRAETLAGDPAHREGWPAVTARAVAGLDRLVELAFPLLAPGGALVAWKRGDLADELAAARRAIEYHGGAIVEVRPVGGEVLAGHVLVVATRSGRGSTTPPGAAVRC
jgi:16S rRNA (guanine527-N7)-methyltransferase